MAEIKNSFLRSKMNKDLDDRLIPNGEYRDAQNISVGKSEADDIGALETVLGNTLKSNFGLSNSAIEVVGQMAIEERNSIIVFLSDYTDPYTNGNPTLAPSTNNCYIFEYSNGTATKLVEGNFLNFSINKPVLGISVIESLLFFTDNRNQPRKININLADDGAYYTQESDISVAKYNPYKPISFLKTVNTTTTTSGSSSTLAIANTTGIEKGMSVVEYGNTNIEPQDYIYVTNVVTNTSVTLNTSVSGLTSGDTIYFISTTMTGENITFNFNSGSPETWPGDPDYLESKFIRLSYRFEYDDGEYSLMAPFSQICFIPKQKGYFISGQEDETYRSTVVDFMENGVQNIELLIPFPDLLNKVQPTTGASYKIKSLDILYKESDGEAVKVIDTISFDEPNASGTSWTNNSSTNVYTYQYQSRKPFRTLPSAQTTRVYDKVPVKALAQETSGNRIIYGNFINKYTPPSLLNYIVGVGPKSQSLGYYNWAEYPNHSVKQNRNYQVGFVLLDKWGRQSDVILSQVQTATTTTSDGTVYGGDTIYSPYLQYGSNNISNVREWLGNSLKININSPINSNLEVQQGTPGLYANSRGSFNIAGVTPSITTSSPFTYTFTVAGANNDLPIIGSYLRGEYTDFVKVTNVTGANPYVVTCDGQVNTDIYSLKDPAINPDNKFSYNINPIGWYSYKIVVKQQEQDYYNVYLPGILKGYPDQTGATASPLIPFPSDPPASTANIVLLNDNINKVPRDLSEVGPDQKQFRSSVQLFGRVTNYIVGSNPGASLNNKQYYPGTSTDTAISIATTNDSNMEFNNLSALGQQNIYQLDSKPLIARLSTSTSIGVTTNTTANLNMQPFLAVYETEPQDSLLDIFWETPTVDLIADLNYKINSAYTGVVGFQSFNSNSLTEALNGNFVTGLSPVGVDGGDLTNTELVGSFSVRNANGAVITNNSLGNPRFTLTRSAGAPYTYSFGISNTVSEDNFVFLADSTIRTYVYTVTLKNITTGVISEPLELTFNLQNVVPVINGGSALPAINGIQSAFTGAIGSAITGVNGAAVAALNQQELVWSIQGGNSNNYFEINQSGQLSKIVSGNVTAGTYNLTIRLADAGGSSEKTQQINVINSVIGNPFTASPAGTFDQSCAYGLPVNVNCGNDLYYNQTSATPTVNDIIRVGPNGNSSPLAMAGYYSYDCSNQGQGNRKYFQISGNDGKITSVSTC